MRSAVALFLTVLLAGAGRADEPRADRLLVFAAGSLGEALREVATAFERARPGIRVELNLAGSQTLVHQLREGAPADVLATADRATMEQAAVARLLAGPPRVFARNALAIVVAPGNPKAVTGLRDLARPGLVIGLCAPAVPCGRYAREAFERAGVAVPAGASEELDVKGALAKVVAGEADAAVVYRTDVRAAGERVTGVALPPEHDVVARYPVATVRDVPTARAFVDFLVGDAGQAVLARHGFLRP
jgi:molybdate transport system substrate-binding protein